MNSFAECIEPGAVIPTEERHNEDQNICVVGWLKRVKNGHTHISRIRGQWLCREELADVSLMRVHRLEDLLQRNGCTVLYANCINDLSILCFGFL